MFRRTAFLTLAGLLTLAACSSDNETDESEGSDSKTGVEVEPDTETPTGFECSDPLADNPESVDAYELITCTTLAMADTEGYVTTTTVGGTEETVLRVDSEPMTVEVNYPDGSIIIANATDSWVKPAGGEWTKGDVSSNDYLTAQATQVFVTYQNSHDPLFTTMGMPAGTSYTVAGTEEIDGVEYTIITALFEDDQQTSELQMWVGPDYQQHRVLTTMSAPDAETLTVESVYSEWDTPQEITLPE